MDDSTDLDLNDEEMVKAKKVLKQARDIFQDLNINVEGSKIVIQGNDRVMECKHWFNVKVGKVRLTGTRPITKYDDEDPYCTLQRHEYTKFITYEKMKVFVCNADFLEFDGKIDCFVNPTNARLTHQGQISKLLQVAGGQPYETACAEALKDSKVKTAQCIVTQSGNMRTEHIIHAVCPVPTENDVFPTVFNCLKVAEENHFQTIAFSFICTGHGQLDIELCSQQYAYAVLEFSRLRENTFAADEVYFIDKDKDKVDKVNRVFGEILPRSDLQLLEVPLQDYSKYNPSKSNDTTNVPSDDINPNKSASDGSGEEYGQRKCVVTLEKTSNIEKEQGHENMIQSDLQHCFENSSDMIENEFSWRSDMRSDVIHSRRSEHDDNEKPENETDLVGTRGTASADNKEIPELNRMIGNYKLVIKKADIRNIDAVAIVCPENEKAIRGGLLAVSIKCRFRHSFDAKKLSKLEKNDIATTEVRTESSNVKYILHVRSPVWKSNSKEDTFKRGLDDALEGIFNKLKRHKKRNIRSLAIPLFGIDNVDDVEVVGKCCEWQIDKMVEILNWKDKIVNLQEVYLVNRCEKITITLGTELTVKLCT